MTELSIFSPTRLKTSGHPTVGTHAIAMTFHRCDSHRRHQPMPRRLTPRPLYHPRLDQRHPHHRRQFPTHSWVCRSTPAFSPHGRRTDLRQLERLLSRLYHFSLRHRLPSSRMEKWQGEYSSHSYCREWVPGLYRHRSSYSGRPQRVRVGVGFAGAFRGGSAGDPVGPGGDVWEIRRGSAKSPGAPSQVWWSWFARCGCS